MATRQYRVHLPEPGLRHALQFSAYLRNGLARSFEEFEPGLAGFAVALPRGTAQAPLALSIAVPTLRLNAPRAMLIEAALLAGAQAPWQREDGFAD